MDSRTPPSLRDLGYQEKKQQADISAWIPRSNHDIAVFLSEGVDPDIEHYDEFRDVDELREFILGRGEYDGILVNEEDASRGNQRYDGDLSIDRSVERSSSWRFDSDERVEESLTLYSEENEDAWLEYTEVSHE